MKWGILNVAFLLLVISASAQVATPSHAQEAQNNDAIVKSKYLAAFHEPSLSVPAGVGIHEYRFIWLRTFHHPVSVRLKVNTDGTSMLTVKVTSGKAGYDWGRLAKHTTQRLSVQQTERFLDLVKEQDYWNLPDREVETDVIRLDGAQWILEAVKDGKYKAVTRWSPLKGPIHVLGLSMLIDLAKLRLLCQEVY